MTKIRNVEGVVMTISMQRKIVSVLVAAMAVFVAVFHAGAKAADKPLGYGFPGKLVPYEVSADLQNQLSKFGMSAWWFVRNPIDTDELGIDSESLPTNAIPFLLYTPLKTPKSSVPMVVYFAGNMEQGFDLSLHFRQTAVFRKVIDPSFQQKHPCYLFAPLLPKNAEFAGSGFSSTPLGDLVSDAMYEVIRRAKRPTVDTDRLYATGLSCGGTAAFDLLRQYHGRFAAVLPISGTCTLPGLPKDRKLNIWMLYNDEVLKNVGYRKVLDELAAFVNGNGGDCRFSSFPNAGHNAWDKAWSEDKVWDWLFEKSLKGKVAGLASPGAARLAQAKPQNNQGAADAKQETVVCTASKEGKDAASGPERGMDMLDATCYVSCEPMGQNDWWQAQFPTRRTGRIQVTTGGRDGLGMIVRGRVDVSTDGKRWERGGTFRKDGTCTFTQRMPVSFIRIVNTGPAQIMAVREVEVTSK